MTCPPDHDSRLADRVDTVEEFTSILYPCSLTSDLQTEIEEDDLSLSCVVRTGDHPSPADNP